MKLIVGDSMTKLRNGWEMAERIRSNCKAFVITLSGETVSYMEDYTKCFLRNPPNHLILHIGTNDLSSRESSVEIAKSIINVAFRLKNEIHYVSVLTN